MKNPIIVITGPTASGKTDISIELAKKFQGEIICADSMTVYRSMDIGTAKPEVTKSKMVNNVPHHLLDIVNPNEEFNVSDFKRLASEKIQEIHARGNIPFLVGGSTMYIDAVVYGYTIPPVAPDISLRKELDGQDCPKLFARLIKLDPDTEWTIDRNNKRRLVRALEVCIKSGKPFTAQKGKIVLSENILYLAVETEREKLYEKISTRVDKMIADGFVGEVEGLYKKYDYNTAMQATGYKQIAEYLDEKTSLAEAIDKTKQVHRNYAKRQVTWLRKNPDVIWIKSKEEAENKINSFLKK